MIPKHRNDAHLFAHYLNPDSLMYDINPSSDFRTSRPYGECSEFNFILTILGVTLVSIYAEVIMHHLNLYLLCQLSE